MQQSNEPPLWEFLAAERARIKWIRRRNHIYYFLLLFNKHPYSTITANKLTDMITPFPKNEPIPYENTTYTDSSE